MFKVYFYKNKNGKSPVLDYLRELIEKNDKDSRIKANKILTYIDYLEKHGTQAKEPYAKYLSGDIWELRPLKDRILYAAQSDKGFILLHIFRKSTQKTPKREVEKAKRNLTDYENRGEEHG